MPVAVPTVVNVTGIASQQVNQASQARTTPKNFGQLTGEVSQWNPNIPVTMIRNWINEAYRSVIARRMWYGLMVRGQVVTPGVYTAGTVTVTAGSNVVTGVGTNWTAAILGQQLRVGFSTGFYNISKVDGAGQIELDLPWGNATQVNVGYSIMQVWVTLGYNIKMILEMVNQRQGYRLYTQLPQAVLNKYDTWRTSTGWTFMCAPKEPTTDGQPQFELYPAPTFQQAFPFLAYTQPPALVKDSDFPAPFLRDEALMNPAIANSLVFGGPKNNDRYDTQTASFKLKEGEARIAEMMNEDDCLYPKDHIWDYGQWPYSKHGSLWLQSHAGELD